MPLEIRPVESKKELEAFLHVPWTLGMKSDPNWVPPLLDDYRRSLNPKKSPFLKHGEVKCFLALQDGHPVGRISAQIDTDFDKQWPQEKGVAFFGFFDSKDDPAVARALFDAAAAWARGKGRTTIRGPFILDSKGEVGVLVEGFDTPPRIGMPHNRPYLGPLIAVAQISNYEVRMIVPVLPMLLVLALVAITPKLETPPPQDGVLDKGEQPKLDENDDWRK